jgi:hypothetical protein
MYGNSVQLYRNSPNKAKHSDSFSVCCFASTTKLCVLAAFKSVVVPELSNE